MHFAVNKFAKENSEDIPDIKKMVIIEFDNETKEKVLVHFRQYTLEIN